MSFFRKIADFFESLFMGSPQETHTKQELKKIENELKTHQPTIFKNGLVQPNIAESFRQLYIHTKPIEELLLNTISCEDLQRKARFSDILIETGFTGDKQDLRLSLTYENRKEEILPAPNPIKIYEMQNRNFEKLLKDLTAPEFLQIDLVFCQLENLSDICRFNYVSAITPFDPNFQPNNPETNVNFTPIPPSTLEHIFQDFYYIVANFKITSSTARALITLSEQLHGESLSESQSEEIISHLKKISTIIHKIFAPQTLLNFLSIAKRNPITQAQTATYERKTISQYCDRLKKQFTADEERIKIELQDDTILSEISKLFNGRPLAMLQGYNAEMNNFLQDNAALSFTWIIPLQIIKTFFVIYFNQTMQSLFETLVIEGFFDNPHYKSEFSANVYYCNETINRITEFEKLFEKTGQYATNLLTGYVRDSHKDSNFLKTLATMVKEINANAKSLIQSETAQFFSLAQKVNIILAEAKKPTAEYITNVKMLFSSARSKEASDTLEKEFPYWKIFLEIMKNYAIIGDIEKQVP